jgi:catechol 2,3-dioxygenase-like lactoylglutathione lyase family enzyme
MPTPPTIECDYLHPTLTVSDIAIAVDFYTDKLGFKQAFLWSDPPGSPATFAGVTLGHVQVFLSKGTPTGGSRVFFNVGDADELYAFHRANGVEIVEPIADRSYEIRDYAIRDLDVHCLTFGHNLLNAGTPLEIERVDVPVRLEKRLAALLQDLAAQKRMSVNSCLEEMLLHTNEGVEPHTKTTLRYIQELKKKHGIDYDCHASYRFVER